MRGEEEEVVQLAVQVITTLKDIAKPISQLSFPAITVCGSGLNMNLVLEEREIFCLSNNFNYFDSYLIGRIYRQILGLWY